MYSAADRIDEDALTAVSATAFCLAMTLLCVFSHEALALLVRVTTISAATLCALVAFHLGLKFGKRCLQRSEQVSAGDKISSEQSRPLNGWLTPSPQAVVSQTACSASARIPHNPEIHTAHPGFASSPSHSSACLHSELPYKP